MTGVLWQGVRRGGHVKRVLQSVLGGAAGGIGGARRHVGADGDDLHLFLLS